MRRSLVTLVAFTALAAWAGAQGPPLTAADRVRLFKADQTLIDSLVDHGVKVADADEPLKRADACRKTALSLATALKRMATDDQDPDRVAELADLLGEVVREGLTPNLQEAREVIRPGDRREPDLLKLREDAATDLDALRAAVPAGKVGDHPKVKDALDRLAKLQAEIGKVGK